MITGAKELGIDLSVEQVNSLFIYLAELKKWNRKINLTAIRDERDVIIKHVLDSLSYINGFGPPAGPRLLDMGSGAGFPAFPIKVIKPDISVTLVESVKKKASFLRHVIRTLGLAGAEVIDKRIEEIENSSWSLYDVVTARAFATMGAALAAGAPFLRTGGLMVLSRGPEETISEKEFRNTGVHVEKKIELMLPHSDYKRAIWVFKKT
ncbi:MAG TPA: 16S rRNA (guanine(527)-N(7))-methyltransferase RsmG [Nitrospirota bacterium]